MSISQKRRIVSERQKKKTSESMTLYHAEHDNVKEAARIANSKPKSETTKKRISEARKEMFASGDISQNISKLSDATINQYLYGAKQSIGVHYSTTNKRDIHYRSKSELDYMKKLDSDQNIKEWSFMSFWIEYEFKGDVKKYIPQFLVEFLDGSKKVIDVNFTVLNSLMRAKVNGIKAYCETNNMIYEEVKL